MDPRFIVRRRQTVRCAVAMVATMLASGCASILGIEELSQQPMDAGPDGYTVRGTATGVLGPVALELRIDGDSELLTVPGDGTFAFATRLADGASYTVMLAETGVPCTLRNQTGVITDADATVELACTGASLASVVVSSIAPAVTLVPGTTDYVIDLPLWQSAVTLAATVAMAGDTLTIAGAPVASGAASAEIPLNLGDTPVDIVVENGQGWQRTYHLTLRRAAKLAQYAYGKASNTDAYDNFGYRVALSGDTLAVSALGEDSAARGVDGDQDDDTATDSGAVYVFRRTGTTWQQEAYVKASNSDAEDSFGISVALSGDTLAVGALGEDSAATGVDGDQANNAAEYAGAVYVFRRTGSDWQQEAYIKASNTNAADSFGASVALSGNILAVGAYGEDSAATGVGGDQANNAAEYAGAVYVFRRTGSDWQQEAYIKASNTDSGDHFGWSVALSGDTLAVGAYGEDSAARGVNSNQEDNAAATSGAVYVFRHNGSIWGLEGYLKASNTDSNDEFGSSVTLSGDTLAVGADGEDSAATGVGGNQDSNSAPTSGAVYVFRRAGTAWQQEAYLKASNSGSEDVFGSHLALSGDILAVGAQGEDSAVPGLDGDQNNDAATDSGAAYVFRRTGTTWQQEYYLKASNAGSEDFFGMSVALSGDTLAVCALYERSAATGVGGNQADDSAPGGGAVYIFH